MKHSKDIVRALIAIPAYNEEQNIQNLLAKLGTWKKDVVVIDDGSEDKTASLVRESGFTCLSRESNLGLSEFFRTAKEYGLRHDYTHLIALDGDGQHDPQYIPQFIKALEKYDLVSGNRFADLSGIPASKIASNMFAAHLFKHFLNLTFPDVACGFRGIRLTDLPDNLIMSRFGIIYDMLIQHALSGKQTGFVGIPVIYHNSDPMNTKSSEISGLLSAVSLYTPSSELRILMESLKNKNDFRICLSGINFQACYQPPDAYLFTMPDL